MERTRGASPTRCSPRPRSSPTSSRRSSWSAGMTRMPAVQEAVKTSLPARAVQGRAPRRGGGAGRGPPGRRADAAVEPGAPAGRHARRAWGWRSPAATSGCSSPRTPPSPPRRPSSSHTAEDGQTTVKIMVLQGESELAHQNELLGEFILTGPARRRRAARWRSRSPSRSTPRASSRSPRGTRRPGSEQSITVTASGGLTEDELKKILEQQADTMLEARISSEVEAEAERRSPAPRPRSRRSSPGCGS